ncbi:AbrB family transcriptional regulator [Haladaptatus sp. W1]|uniref:AbrB/MazE/SpoVT family DNA-binding domain-containing protein n=1 Tax=Haladaptatus sp. W1 TaxID=1897478 RepID=UPI000849CFBF|nr:AbrB/MazE/SpoVT family DNA-binding domain-containing protein [Haladaptatus sp. W1]ODR79718.1 AbrB family transcriptional regulator [Haladaptatus sp. W1]
MATNDSSDETKVTERGLVTIPAEIRHRLDIEPGDKLRWGTTESGDLTVEVVRQRSGAFDDAPTADLGGDSLETHDMAGNERNLSNESPERE